MSNGRLGSLPRAALALAIACAPVEPPLPVLELTREGAALALERVTLLDPIHGPGGPATVVIQGDRIAAVLEGGSYRLPEHVERVNAAGRYLLPGLWDLHTHLTHADAHAPVLLVTQGVTGVRDLGAVLEEIDALRDQIASGELLGPRILRSGPTLNGAQNGPHHRVIETPEAARGAVADRPLSSRGATRRDSGSRGRLGWRSSPGVSSWPGPRRI